MAGMDQHEQAIIAHETMTNGSADAHQKMVESHQRMMGSQTVSPTGPSKSLAAMNEHERAAVAHEFMNNGQSGPHQAMAKRIVACSVQADGEGSICAVLISLIDFSVTGYMATSLPLQGHFYQILLQLTGINAKRIFFMKARNTLFAVLMLSLPAISAEHSEMKMTDMSTSASSQEYMAGMKDMHDKMMAAVNESNPDKAFAKGMVAHHEGAIAMAETELKYGKDPKMRKLAQDIIKAQKGEIEQMNKWLDSQK